MNRAIYLVAAIFSLAGAPAFAWGVMGHEATALIAYHFMTPAARQKLEALLASDPDTLTGPDFASRSAWADHYRTTHRETAMWHFVDIELDRPDLSAACFASPKLEPGEPASAGPAQDCIVDKIDEFAAELHNPATPTPERLLALKFLIHFVGDLHQPLHAADHEDRGGNCIAVEAASGERGTNLHAYWDTAVVERLASSSQAVAAALTAQITPADVTAWTPRGPASSATVAKAVEAWAWESHQVAGTVAYNLPSRPTCDTRAPPEQLSSTYEARAEKAAAIQLEKAGVRLAWLLNQELR